ncbi:hypothetical protein [Planomicrobium okeanokoites]|uniref:hypothetical protein n=1 Tax=Planomicrobium okeanokoites TaxID=244 RepID=UPI002491BAD3|nr:hypothetical protein [Planomicrobium okeanokoites]
MKKLSMYTSFLVKSLDKEVLKAKKTSAGYLKVDLEEMEYLLSELKHSASPSAESNAEEHFCISCTKPTEITRSDQYVIKPNSITVEIKCLDCVIDTLKGDQAELEQIRSVNWFLKEHDLEEDFEAFQIELDRRKQD